MRILAIDPGNVKSAWLLYDTETKTPIDFKIEDNEVLLTKIRDFPGRLFTYLAIEMIASYGMPVGKTVFDTCVWIGRFIEAWKGKSYKQIYRMDVKMCLCKSTRAKDANIRQALIDRYPATGNGAIPQIGTIKQPGPLYGISKDVWSALAVAVTYSEILKSLSKS